MIVQDSALVLQVREFSETSQIVALWTEGNGRVTALAKGVLRPRRFAFDGPFEAASEYSVGFYLRGRGEGLSILSEASQTARHEAPRTTLEAWWAWSEAVEAVLALTQEMDSHPGLMEAFRTLLEEGGDLPAFLLRLLALTGHAPVMDRCVVCGAGLPRGPVHFAYWQGGAACLSCVGRAGPMALLDPRKAPVRRRESVLGRYVAHLAGRAPVAAAARDRSRRVLRSLAR